MIEENVQDAKTTPKNAWLVGSDGAWAGFPGADWQCLGPPYLPEDLYRTRDGLLVATGHGLWFVDADGRWVQRHDEVLTELLSVVTDARDEPVVAGSYGVSLPRRDEAGHYRWHSTTDARVPDERYTNVVRLLSDTRWLAGTEAGLLQTDDAGANWDRTALWGSPVRCLERVDNQW